MPRGEVDATVRINGLRELRRDLKRLAPVVEKELRGELKSAAQRVATEAAGAAPRRTGTLAGSYRGVGLATRAVVRSNVFYARFIEFGWTPRGGAAVPGRNVVGRALERQSDRIVDEVGDAIERAAGKAGWI